MRDRGKHSTKIFVAVILFIFVASAFAVATFSGSEQSKQASEGFEVSGYLFYEGEQGYTTETEKDGRKYRVAFFSDPRDIEGIAIDSAAVELIKSASKLYIARNPNQEESSNAYFAYQEIAMISSGLLGTNTVEAFSEDSDPPNIEVPLKTCADAVSEAPVIEIRLGDKTEVRREGSCVVVEGASLEGQRLAADKLAMHLAGIAL